MSKGSSLDGYGTLKCELPNRLLRPVTPDECLKVLVEVMGLKLMP